MARHVVARADEIAPGERKRVLVDGRAIVVFNVKGEYFALSDVCPHKGGRLSEGKLGGLVTSNGPGNYTYQRDGEIIRCPWHAWEFDLRTGRSYCDPRRMRTLNFSASVASGQDILEGPYQVDTFKVSAEAAYLVIEMA